MPSIHVIYDPKDVVRQPRAEELRSFRVSHVVMACQDEFSPAEAADMAKALGERLLAKVARK